MPARRRGETAEERRDARREAILDAALDLFAQRGYLASPIEDLCREAHVSTKSFYESFESREACYFELMRRTSSQIKQGMAATLATLDPELSPAVATTALLDAFAELMSQDPRRPLILFGHGSTTTLTVERERRANRRWAAAFFTDLLRTVNPDISLAPGVASGVIGGLFEIVADWVADPEGTAATHDSGDLSAALRAFWSVVDQGLNLEKKSCPF